MWEKQRLRCDPMGARRAEWLVPFGVPLCATYFSMAVLILHLPKKLRVALRFLNDNPNTPTQGDTNIDLASPEIEVCRHLTRDGESRYLINQTPCRLRDISELFMDTGIGVDAYSVMEQSKIDLILNVRPEERRFLFDEVAGITKYKHRKKTALRKLEQTEQNLVRINDVIQELQRETEALKEQAEQARHYNAQHAQLKQYELDLARREYDKLHTDYSQAQTDLDEVLTGVAEASETLKAAEERIEGATDRQTELDAAIRTGQTTLREIETQIEQIERQIVLHKERQLNIQKQRERALQTLDSLKAQQTALSTQRQERTQEYQKLEAAYKIEESRLAARQQLLTQLDERITGRGRSLYKRHRPPYKRPKPNWQRTNANASRLNTSWRAPRGVSVVFKKIQKP